MKKTSSDITVSVIIVTYNQRDYIKQSIDSVLSQITKYSFEIIIGDDMSTDGTKEICETYSAEYDNIILVDRKENLGVAGNWADCVCKARGKYLMMLDGDDYWHNPNKMQIQVDFMDNNPMCVICHTDTDLLYVKNGSIVKDFKKTRNVCVPEGYIQKFVLEGKENIVSSTICIRTQTLLNNVPLEKYSELRFPYEDWPTIVILSAYGEIRYLPVSTTTYRKGQISITNTIDYNAIIERFTKLKEMTKFLYSLFPDLGTFKDGDYFDTQVYHSLLIAAYENNDYKCAHVFAKKDPTKSLAVKMASNIIFFKIFRLYRNFIKIKFCM